MIDRIFEGIFLVREWWVRVFGEKAKSSREAAPRQRELFPTLQQPESTGFIQGCGNCHEVETKYRE